MNEPLSASEILARILAATVAGLVVGLERESRGRPAGLRTTILACVASAVAMVISEVLYFESAVGAASAQWRPDPARLGAGILTGIGFLGAGTILRHENMIRGVTTAASLWFVTVLGLAFGSGLFALGALGVVIALFTLFVLPTFERHLPSDWYVRLMVAMEVTSFSEEEFAKHLQSLGAGVRRMEMHYDLVEKRKTFTCELQINRTIKLELASRITASLQQHPGVLQIKWT
jgi:putative Mg2+ transporter-C (MgtC) family protein